MAKFDGPRHVTRRKLADGYAYYWQPPPWARNGAVKHGVVCPLIATPLGKDLARAFETAERLNEALDGWRKGEAHTELMRGTVAWLFSWYQTTKWWRKLSPKSKIDYRAKMKLVAELPMKEGVFGRRLAGSVTATVADKLYEILEEQGPRQATYAMQVCRLIWNRAGRNHDVTGIPQGQNPFRGMSLDHSVKAGNYAATLEDLKKYRFAAFQLGYHSMNVGALLAFELVQRVSDVFGFYTEDDSSEPEIEKGGRGLQWIDFVEGRHIEVTQHKTGKEIVIPLAIVTPEEDIPLFPDLEAALLKWKKLAKSTDGLIVTDDRTGLPYKQRRMSTVHRRICDHAGLPKKLTFTSFRHGGATELGNSGSADIRSISGHTQVSTSIIYNQANQEKAREIQLRRLEYRDRIQNGGGAD